MTDTRSEFHHLVSVYLPVGIAVVALVIGAFGVALIRGRRRAAPDLGEGHLLEALYVAVLAVIAGVLMTLTLRTEDRVDALAASPAVVVQVTAYQWGWSFAYPGRRVQVIGDYVQPPTMAVPTDETVRFELRSRDVNHAFWVPSERFKKDAIPGRTNRFDLVFDRPGMNAGKCAEFCGLRHARMDFNVLALPRAKFDDWIASRAGGTSNEAGKR